MKPTGLLSATFGILYACLILMSCVNDNGNGALAAPQDPSIELPVQLIGFPVIILAVRLSNFVKKLAYSLNPRTYMQATRTRRAAIDSENTAASDVLAAEKKMVTEFGERVCIYEQVCIEHANRAIREEQEKDNEIGVDWNDILRSYQQSSNMTREFYLLSVFLGDIVASPDLCHLLAKRPGRSCTVELH